MPSKSKNKGNGFERVIAHELTDVFGYNFERVPNSGAFVGGKNNTRYNNLSKSQQLIYEGDILVPDELAHMKIECKNYKDFAFHQLLTENKQLDSWIEQAVSDEKTWFLIYKINRRGTFVLMDRVYYDKIKSCLINKNNISYKQYTIVMYDDFFSSIKHELLRIT